MGNKILGKRSRSFYKGFNDRQLDYLHDKFQTLSENNVLKKDLFLNAYKLNDFVCDKFLTEMDFTEDQKVDQYQFVCIAHSLCSMTVQELGEMFYKICTKGGRDKINQKNLENFTAICLSYNAYLCKIKIKDKDIQKANHHKFRKYDFDNNKVLDKEEFVKICIKDEDYKRWMFNMGFITERQLDFGDQIYQLVDSDIDQEIHRHQAKTNANVDKIKRGIQHRIQDDQFQVIDTVGEQSAPSEKPWKKAIKGIDIPKQNPNSPSQNLTVDHIYGYRSYDCRNNLKFDSKGRIVYHQAAVGIVLQLGSKTKVQQSFIIEHQDDISCLDISQDLVATGQVGTKPMVILWQTNKRQGILKENMILTKQLEQSVGNVCISRSKQLLAVSCNDQDHRIIIYDLKRLRQLESDLTSQETGIVAFGPSGKNIIMDLKFTPDQKTLVAATLKELIFITFENNTLNANRGKYGNFSNSPTLCLASLSANYKGEHKEYIISGMANGSVYFWQNSECVKAVCGHSGSVATICRREDCESFISGDKSGKIIIWDVKFQKQKTLTLPKTNCSSHMIVALSCNRDKQILIGTKSSDIFIVKMGDDFSRARKVMSGHSEGTLWGLAIHQEEPYFYTGGDDQRLIKWEYKTNKTIQKEIKCPYKIRSIDFNNNRNIVVVGYSNGVIDTFGGSDLEKKPQTYRKIKNPDEQVLNLVKFDQNATLCAVCYQYPSFKVVFLAIEQKSLKPVGQIQLHSKILNLDFQKHSKFIQLNTADYDYQVFDISNISSPKKMKVNCNQVKGLNWVTHSVVFSPATQGIMTEGVSEEDIICCDRSKKFKNVVIFGDKYSKLKLFNYPTKQSQIFNKYFGHSNQITSIKFNYSQDYVISIGGEEKSIIVWKFDPDIVNNQFFIQQLNEDDSDAENLLDELSMKKKKVFDQFDAEEQQGQQSMATKPFLGQIKTPSNFQEAFNPKRDNRLPKESLSIKHVFGIRNKYLKDDVRNMCKFTKGFKDFAFPTACMAVKMNIKNRTQDIYLQHKEDIVSFAIDTERKIMATGQMAEKNPINFRKKILTVYVWDIDGKKVLSKLQGFHTIAVVLLEFSPNSKLLFTCGNDDKNTFAVYDWKSSSILYSGPISRAKVNGISWKNDHEFITCGNDHVKFWVSSKGRQGKITGKTQGMFCCISSKSIYITGDGSGGLYNWIGDRSSEKIKAHRGKVQALAISGDYLYSGGDDGKILGWRLEKNGQIKHQETFYDTRSAFVEMMKSVSIQQQEFGVLSIDFSTKGDILIATKGASVIHVTNNRSSSTIIHQGHYRGQLWALSTQQGQMMVTGGDDGTVRLWDIEGRRQVNRQYFDHKIRGLDSSNQRDSKIVIADVRAKLYLYNKNLTEKLCQYTGKPYDFNLKEKRDPWVEDIKFSPDSQHLVYGCHGKSMYLQYVNVKGRKLQKHQSFQGGTSALLHVDWSKDSSIISINTQAYELIFYGLDGKQQSATSTRDTNWFSWTQKLGFPVQGIFQGVDYTDVNTVCKQPFQGNFIAVGYDDQTIRLFKYPCYIPKQVCKQYFGHSSHVTKIRFTPQHMISIGGLDRTIIVWDVENRDTPKVRGGIQEDDQSDGLDDIDEDVDLPGKAIQRKKKKQKIAQFYEVEDQGDQFMAIKPWLGAIKQPTEPYPKQSTKPPDSSLELQYVFGYRCKDSRQNLFYSDKQTLIFHAAAVLIYHNIKTNTQQILCEHADDILSIDYHAKTNQVITGQLGPKPLVCLWKDGQLKHRFKSPVKKGVLALGISLSGDLAACSGMDQDHYVTVMDLQKGKTLATLKGGKKVILKLGWISDTMFVTAGISHFKYWTFEGGKLTSKQERCRGNFVSLACKDGMILTGASKGVLKSWPNPTKGGAKIAEVTLQIQSQGRSKQLTHANVVESISIQPNFIAAGTKDGYIFILDKSLKTLNSIDMGKVFLASDAKSQNPALRAIDFLEGENRMCVGTLGAQIYTVQTRDLTKDTKCQAKNILKCHYSPNNSWTNEVWGLCIEQDLVFTCSDDATLRCWSLPERKLLSCASLNYGPEKMALQKDKRTKDFSESAKGRAVCLSPDKKEIIVGCKNGTVRVYTYNEKDHEMKFKLMFRHAKEWISDIKTAYNTVIIGSHDNAIYVYDYDPDTSTMKRKYRPMKKHSSYITHMDVSRDSCFLQSTCGAYELLFWDLNSGKQITSGATMLRNQQWSNWTCNLGWPVQGIYPRCTDGTFINSVDRSHFSKNDTLAKDDHQSPYLLAAGNDNGKVCLYNFPCTIKSSGFVEGNGHSSHVTNVCWSQDDRYIMSTGGQDQCLMMWRVKKNLK